MFVAHYLENGWRYNPDVRATIEMTSGISNGHVTSDVMQQ